MDIMDTIDTFLFICGHNRRYNTLWTHLPLIGLQEIRGKCPKGYRVLPQLLEKGTFKVPFLFGFKRNQQLNL